MSESFPRQHARTRRFSLGAPRNFSVSGDGRRVFFLRSGGGDDPLTCLWVLDAASGETELLVDPGALGVEDGDLTSAERARRERAREQAGGVVSFALDSAGRTASFVLGGVPFVHDTTDRTTSGLEIDGTAFDARVSPDGTFVAYVDDRELRIVGANVADRSICRDESPTVSWGSAEFVAGEEMGRTRGFWWSPDSRRLVAARVDVAPVDVWYLADPTNPATAPRSMRYPAAGTPNAEITLAVFDVEGNRVEIDLGFGGADARWEYLADVVWNTSGLFAVVQPRDQRSTVVVEIDPDSGATSEVAAIEDRVWVELVPGSPSWIDGALVTVEERGDTRQMCLDGEAVSGANLWVRSVVGSYLGGIVFTASADPTETHVYRWTRAGVEQLTVEPGVHSAVVGGPTMVVTSRSLEKPGVEARVLAGAATFAVDDLSEHPVIEPSVTLMRSGEREVATAVLLPSPGSGRDTGGPLPVLLDPYGGPHAQRVQRSHALFTSSQWFADQGFVVIVADGRGTPGRTTSWERSVWGDLAGPVLDDQIAALEAVADRHPGRLALDRVAIRGWSFGGYLAALAVMRRPDVFHAAVAGAPVTDWLLYDTHYTERYLGHPDEHPEHYRSTSLVTEAEALTRPLMLIHGLADDNVVSAHTLQLSGALLAAGRAHEVLPLSGVSHMTPQEVVAENLLLLQLDFLRRSLP
ncbi:MAG: S9 family peptidase [Actinomycetia bacterium]|nr:S9 family peptidase [Actinomycetes bacterium]